jgi:16S rRNA (cytidine1402-2'-O)-methyltransferase
MEEADSTHTLIFYESPYRIGAFLEDAMSVLGDRQSAIANDLTKKFETLYRGRLSELIETLKKETPRGEYTVVIEGKRD